MLQNDGVLKKYNFEKNFLTELAIKRNGSRYPPTLCKGKWYGSKIDKRTGAATQAIKQILRIPPHLPNRDQ